MPLYEYECKECGRRTEKIQKFSDAELTVCPHCGGRIERTLTAPAVQFKGGGWYKDLYSSAKPAASGSGDSGKGDSGKSGGEASKPAESSAPAASSGGSSGSDSGSGAAASTSSSSPPATAAKS